jgi:hypothetical protein
MIFILQLVRKRNASMLFFKCRISLNEITALERNLPQDIYCISRDKLDQFHYGVIRSSGFNKLLNVLSGETLEDLEYLNDDEFRNVVSRLKSKSVAFSGNTGLLVE